MTTNTTQVEILPAPVQAAPPTAVTLPQPTGPSNFLTGLLNPAISFIGNLTAPPKIQGVQPAGTPTPT